MIVHSSDSSEQQRAESVLLENLSRELGISLAPERITVGDGVHIIVDGFNREARIFCEVSAHIGSTKGAQRHKIARDILKMIMAEESLGGDWRKILCFADDNAAQFFRGRS